MVPSDPSLWPAHVITDHIRSRRLSSVDLVESFLDRIQITEPNAHAFVDIYAADARRVSRIAHEAIRAGNALGPLQGIPVALKDLFEISGRTTTGGSLAWRHRLSKVTAVLVERLRRQGLIILGKTHTTEFALGVWGTNQHLGTPRNPWDLKMCRVPGGSSSGSAVAVSGRMAPWAVGTDTGGSVRIPAAWCGVVGLKITKGVIPTCGVLSLSETLDSVGPMACCVEDVALLFYAMRGMHLADLSSEGSLLDGPLQTLKRGVAGLRLGRLKPEALSGTSSEILESYERSLELLTKKGAHVVPVHWPDPAKYNKSISTVVQAEAYRKYKEIVGEFPELLDEVTRSELKAGGTISDEDYRSALALQEEAFIEYASVFTLVNAVMTPTVPMVAPALEHIDRGLPLTRFTRIVNFARLCALALPNGFTAEGMPSSLQIICPGHSESMALRVGWAYENATDWHRRLPWLGSNLIMLERSIQDKRCAVELITSSR